MKVTHLIPLNAIPLWVVEDFGLLSEQEMKDLLSLEYQMNSSGGKNLITSNRQILDLPQFTDLRGRMQEALATYTHDILSITDTFRFTDSWSTRNPTGTHHPAHIHANSIFSGVYYAQVESGAIEFLFERQFSQSFRFKYNFKNYNLANSTSWWLDCKPGMLVLFPSWLEHQVKVNESDTERVIIGFNTFVQGTMGGDREIDNLTVS